MLTIPRIWWVRSDPCGTFSASFTVFLILYAQFVVCRILIVPWYGLCWHIPCYSVCTLLSLVSHCRAQFSNPGVVPKVSEVEEAEKLLPKVPRMCRRCKAIKPQNAHHCSSCERCVIRMDHHCPWVNNCVAIFNQKYFLLFLFYTAVCCIYSGVLLVARFISCTQNLRQCTLGGLEAGLCILTFIEALVFGLFVIIMLWDQFSALFEDLDDPQMSTEGRGSQTKYGALCDVFGEGLSYRWFLPLNPTKQTLALFHKETKSYQWLTPSVPATAAAATTTTTKTTTPASSEKSKAAPKSPNTVKIPANKEKAS